MKCRMFLSKEEIEEMGNLTKTIHNLEKEV